jgi:hypothetical protein
MSKQIFFIMLAVFFVACSQNEPPVGNLTKDHSVEVTYETRKANDTSVLLIRHENVYLRGKLVKSFLRTDTLPAPGDTIQTVDKDDENTVSIPTPKEYEFFVTIK